MTAYSICAGYNSTFKRDEVEEQLILAVKEICSRPDRIAHEACRIDSDLSAEELIEYSESYREPWKDLTIRIERDDRVDIRQLASGGEPGRALKESLRRAFCRLILNEMHRRQMEISIVVS